MSFLRRRYERQIRVPEIGEEGQVRLGAAAVVLGGQGFVREIEATYLRLAGVGRVASCNLKVACVRELDVASLGIDHAAAREVAEGSLRALIAMRHIVFEDEKEILS
ncbi:MAG: hypothetical protein FWD69_01060 [Polyangiaceae bacterium]|nr:hypothetical protein [Polyangiaceae bacterium]